MASHLWEEWDGSTRERMADELIFHGSSRAALVHRYVGTEDDRDE